MNVNGWNKHKIKKLSRMTLAGDSAKAIAASLGYHERTVRDMQIKLGLGAARQIRRPWPEKEIVILRELYAGIPTGQLAKLLGRSETTVYQKARKLNLEKSVEYLASPAACRLRRGDHVGMAFRFKPGHVPDNKGLRRPGWSPGRMAVTQFKPGNHPQTWQPMGSTRITKDGYLQRKVSDTGYMPKDWKGEHVVLWEAANGPVPAGHAVVFKDRNMTNIILENIELISRADLMRRNTIHRYPTELRNTVMLLGALKRKLREQREKQID